MKNSKKYICVDDFLQVLETQKPDVDMIIYGFEPKSGYTIKAIKQALEATPDAAVVSVDKHADECIAWDNRYEVLKENFVDYVCSGTNNLAPYCINRCDECVDARGWCIVSGENCKCKGFNPEIAE